MWFDISVYSFEANTFVAVFQNTTTQKQLIHELEKANIKILRFYDDTLQSWSKALEYRDKETVGHSLRVVDLADQLARAMNFKDGELVEFRRGALLHDVGKMAISDVILHKPGKLDPEEVEIMRQHPQIAYDILFPIKFITGCALDIPYCHHELWDGSGYPRGLKEYEIPQCARLFTVVDVFDAMTSVRPYRIALSKKFTLEYIQAKAGELYDPNVVEAFIKMMGSS
jgi:putative nucleotidyltransferase with HDIG domain